MKIKKIFSKAGNVVTFGTGFNPIMYKPEKHSVTREVANGIEYKKMFSTNNFKELINTLFEAESKHSFKRSMEKDGLTEEDLKKGHTRYQLGMILMMFMMFVPLYNIFSFSLGLPLLEKIFKVFIIVVFTLFISYWYLYFAWSALKIRNRTLFKYGEFINLCKIDISNLSPIEEYTTKVVDKPKIRKKYNIQNNNKEMKDE
jgi:hypothetical protein